MYHLGIAVGIHEPHSSQAVDLGSRALGWGARADISARSVLVTIFGDTIAPLGGQVWLGDLIDLAEPFGFNSRLVRTSISRLAAEGWIQGVRRGRRSRYHLTDFGRSESAQAERRIYYPNPSGWTGRWTIVLTESQHDQVHKLLRWRGFGRIRPGVFARPNHTAEAARDGATPPPAQDLPSTIAQLDPTAEPLIATADFADLDRLVDSPMFRTSLEIDTSEAAYRRFYLTYSWANGLDLPELSPIDAFTLRTMVVHDLRRIRLADPELPAELLGPKWPGHSALNLAAAIYRGVEIASWDHLRATTGLAANLELALLNDRFADSVATQADRPGTDRNLTRLERR